MEIWREVERDTEYQVSNMGRVRGTNGAMLKPSLDTNGYPQVRIRGVGMHIHKLVALGFISNPHGYVEVNHLDEVKINNMDFNLEWCSRLENIEHSFCYEFSVKDPEGKVHTARNQSKFARENDLHPRTFRKLVNGTVHNHKGWRLIK